MRILLSSLSYFSFHLLLTFAPLWSGGAFVVVVQQQQQQQQLQPLRRPSSPFCSSFGTVSSSSSSSSSSTTTTTTTRLFAIGALVRKAKREELRRYVEDGVEDAVMEQYDLLKKRLSEAEGDDDGIMNLTNQTPGPVQEALTRRKGTITVIAEYKRKLSGGHSISGAHDPEVLSPTFREFGASAIAVLADERMGGCTYEDVAAFTEEQRRSRRRVPGPVPVVNADLIVDELQVARSAACGCSAVLLTESVLDDVREELPALLRSARALGLEAIVAVAEASRDGVQRAIDLGARMILVAGGGGGGGGATVEEKAAAVSDLRVPDGQTVTTIAAIAAKNDKQLKEIEEAWAVRDKGYNAVWIGEALYKSGTDETEHPGAIIRSIKSKSSRTWASPKASSGRGEGAKEYLGDILM